MNNKIFYHSKALGCKIRNKKFPAKGRYETHFIKGLRCSTHKKDLCWCGYEWGHHYNTDSLAMNKPSRGRSKDKHIANLILKEWRTFKK